MSNATTSPAVTPVREAIGTATVAEIRELLGGQVGNTDMALLKRVFAWGRANGWYNAPYTAFRVSADRTIAVDLSAPGEVPQIGVARRGRHFWMATDWYPVSSVREAVDILVIESVLPVSFSSMYAAGRASLAPERAA